MGKLLITNSPEWDGMLRKLFAGSGFRESAHVECNDARVTAWKKLCVDNCNFYSCGDDFAACAGTLFYRENFGEEALRMLYEDSCSMTVTELRKNLIGSYVVAVKNGDVIRIFVDETHIGKFYYYIDGGKYILTNTFYHIEKCAKQPLHDDAFLERLTRSCTMSRQTPYQNVCKICAREYFRINLADGSCSVEECPLNDYHRKFSSRDEALNALFEEAKRISALRSKFIHSHRIFLTGGLDSRLEYAMHLYNNSTDVRPHYWKSNYEAVITNGTQNDWEIVEKITRWGGGGTEPQLVDCTEPAEVTFGQDLRPVCDKYGEYSNHYLLLNTKLRAMMESTDTEGLTFGCFGEAIKSLSDVIDTYYKAPFTLSDMIRNIHCKSNVEKVHLHSDTIYDFIEGEMKPLADGMNTADLTRKEAFELYIYSMIEANTTVDSLTNMFAYSFEILAQKPIIDMDFSIPYEWREGDYFTIALTKKFCPKLLEFPYYSHHHFVKYDPATDTVTPIFSLKASVSSFLQHNFKTLFKALHVIYRLVKGDDKSWTRKNDLKIFKLFDDIIRNSPTIAHSKLKIIDTKYYNFSFSTVNVATNLKVFDTLAE